MTELNSYISLGICFGRSFIALGAVLMHWAQFSWAQFYVGAILRGRNSTGAILRAQFYGRNSTGAILRAQFSVGAVLLGCSSTWAQFSGRSPTGAVLRGRNTTCTDKLRYALAELQMKLRQYEKSERTLVQAMEVLSDCPNDLVSLMTQANIMVF